MGVSLRRTPRTARPRPVDHRWRGADGELSAQGPGAGAERLLDGGLQRLCTGMAPLGQILVLDLAPEGLDGVQLRTVWRPEVKVDVPVGQGGGCLLHRLRRMPPGV